jgi:WD40 repeat protein
MRLILRLEGRRCLGHVFRFPGFVCLILTAVLATAGVGRAWSDDVVRSSIPSDIYLHQVAFIQMKGRAPDGSAVLSLAWSPNGQRLAASFDWGFKVAVFDTSTWQEVTSFKGKSFQPERQLAFISDSEIVSSPEDGDDQSALAFYEAATERLVKQVPRPAGYEKSSTVAIAVPADRRYVVALLQRMLTVPFRFEVGATEFSGRLATPIDSVSSIVAGGPGSKVAINVSYTRERALSEVRKEIGIVDVASNSLDRILAGHIPGIGSIAWSPDGRWIASGASMLESKGDGKWIRDPDPLRIWDATTGDLALSFSGTYDPITELAWHPSSAILATVSAKGNGELGSALRLWSLLQRRMIFEYLVPKGVITQVSFDPKSARLVVGWREDCAFLRSGTFPRNACR